jgi:hypothetical protein
MLLCACILSVSTTRLDERLANFVNMLRRLSFTLLLAVVAGFACARHSASLDGHIHTSRYLLQANDTAADDATAPITKLPKCDLSNDTLNPFCDGPEEEAKVVDLPAAMGEHAGYHFT